MEKPNKALSLEEYVKRALELRKYEEKNAKQNLEADKGEVGITEIDGKTTAEQETFLNQSLNEKAMYDEKLAKKQADISNSREPRDKEQDGYSRSASRQEQQRVNEEYGKVR